MQRTEDQGEQLLCLVRVLTPLQNPASVNFDPKFLLTTLCQIYVNLGAKQEFLRALVRDER